jgi:SAM-dependent methyltransferase
VDPVILRTLQSPEGRRLLARVQAEYDAADPLRLGERLRRDHPAEMVAAATTLVALRRRAADKFGPDADRMFFTAESLEQSTRRAVAEHRAARMADAGVRTVLDLGCGIGGDLVAIAATGIGVTGVERDPLRADLARANVAALGLVAEVITGDAEQADRSGFDAVFADPARREDGRRVFDPAAYSPSWAFVRELVAGTACVKVAPGIAHSTIPAGVEAEWVSDRGDLKEAALWSGRLAGCRRRATLLPSGATLTDADDPGPAPVSELGAYIYEPDDAVIRSGLCAAVGTLVRGGLLDPKIAYLTGSRLLPTPFARAYRVLERLPFRERALRAALRERGIGALTIKKRGVGVTPEVLRRRLSLRGDKAATVILTRIAGRGAVLLVEPLG